MGSYNGVIVRGIFVATLLRHTLKTTHEPPSKPENLHTEH